MLSDVFLESIYLFTWQLFGFKLVFELSYAIFNEGILDYLIIGLGYCSVKCFSLFSLSLISSSVLSPFLASLFPLGLFFVSCGNFL